MGQARAALVAAILCAAGCQSDVNMRRADAVDLYGRTSEEFHILSDTRRVTLDFTKPPVNEAIDDEAIFVYVSTPLHPLRGFDFRNSSLGGGWQNTSMTFGGLFQPFPVQHLRYWKWDEKNPDGTLVAWPGAVSPHRVDKPSADMTDVDPRFTEYAAALMDEAHRYGESGDTVMALTPLRPQATTVASAAEDD